MTLVANLQSFVLFSGTTTQRKSVFKTHFFSVSGYCRLPSLGKNDKNGYNVSLALKPVSVSRGNKEQLKFIIIAYDM